MNRKNFKLAAIGAAIAFFVSLPILGAHIEQSASGLSLKSQLGDSFIFAAVIFGLLLFTPFLRHVKMPSLPEPKISENWGIAVLIVIGLVLPFYVGRSALNIATLSLIYVLLGLGLNIVVGYAGLLNLGYAGFYAIGAYTYAILQQYGFGFWTSLPVAAVLAAIVGIILAFPILRLRGDYLAIVTLGFGEIIRLLINNLEWLTRGPKGISNIAAPTLFNVSFTKKTPEGLTSFHQWTGIKFSSEHQLMVNYFIIFALCLVTLWAIKRLIRMPIGRAWEALREDEIACRSLGINPAKVKLSAFAAGALFAGIAGAFFAARQGSVTPESFTFAESALILAIVVLGGSQLGVILAAIAITALPELARGFSEYRMLIFGAIMVLMMLWRPQGLIPVKRPKMELS